MNHNVLKIISILLILFILTACENSDQQVAIDTPYYGLKGPVKSVSHSFDYSNVPSNKDNFAKGRIELDFNTTGKLTRTLHQYTNLEKPDTPPDASQSNYTYDVKGRLYERTSNYGSGSTQKLKYLYKKDALLPYAALMISEYDSQMHFYKHDAKGNLVEVNSVNKRFEHLSSYTAKYNSNDRPLEYTNRFGEDYRTTFSLEYNDKGFVKKEIESTNKGKSVLTYEYLKMDSYNNWISRKVFSDEKNGYVIEKRDIIYY
ncbi:hypothetical protein [Kangiella shandongensis]|uniref:hypothetical protein n=1 Tax=Kangiella shandongensis TaxID=2763258 RepID=UPI001CBD6F41|nr:hypothetical protein [Kangiella shandongensis]